MKVCPKCNTQVNDDAMFCTTCGNSFAADSQPVNNQQFTQQYAQPAPAIDPTDHTAEFSPEEVHDNKIFALLAYIMGIVGVVIALLATGGKPSNYLRFHIKQVLSITILETLAGFITAILCWTCIVAIAGAISILILIIVQIICFFKTAANKSVEAPIVNKFTFLK